MVHEAERPDTADCPVTITREPRFTKKWGGEIIRRRAATKMREATSLNAKKKLKRRGERLKERRVPPSPVLQGGS